MVAVLVFLAAAHADVQRHGGGPRAGLGQAPRRQHRPGRRHATVRRQPLAAAFEHEGRAARHRLHHQALFDGQHRGDQGAAPPDDPGRHLRRARGGLFLPRPHRACGRPGRADVPVRAGRSRAAPAFWLWTGVGGIIGYLGPSLYIDKPHQDAQGRAPGRLPGFHGSAGGLRRRRAEHGGGARPRRPRARAIPIRRLPPTST